MPETKTKGKQGIRYSADKKAEIIKFINDYNAKNKRGGMKHASEKYGVSVVTLSNWAKSTKKVKKTKPATKVQVRKKSKRGRGKKTVVVKTAAPTDLDAILDRLKAIRTEIKTLEKEYNTLKKKL